MDRGLGSENSEGTHRRAFDEMCSQDLATMHVFRQCRLGLRRQLVQLQQGKVMEPNHILGMICGYYLSRFDQRAYEVLGFGTQRATHDALGEALSVPPASVKNWRDEFDPVHDNPRAGWSRREMYPSRRRVIEAIGHLTEGELLAIVRELTRAPAGRTAKELVRTIGDDEEKGEEGTDALGLRGPTGIKAERFFMRYHEEQSQPLAGNLLDRRHDECGYDFEIVGVKERVFIEVKGVSGDQGGVSFTEKEWATAEEKRDNYYFALVRRVASSPEVKLFRDPASLFDPQMRTFTTVQVVWTVARTDLRRSLGDPSRWPDEFG